MKRVFATQGRAVVVDVPEPELRPGEVLVAPAYSVISSGTELHIILDSADPEKAARDTYPSRHYQRPKMRQDGVRWEGVTPRTSPPELNALGYSLAGRVLAVHPSVMDLRPGDRVACSGNQAAFHAERVAVPRSLVTPVPDGVPLDQAAFVTLGAIVTNALHRTGCLFGETVVVYGLGPLGLLATQVARAGGLYVLGLDIDDRRVNDAHEVGATRAINPRHEDPVAAVQAMTNGFGADAVILAVATESSEPLNQSFDLCRQRGCVVGVGAFGMDIQRQRMYMRDVIFYPAVAYGPGRYDPVYEEGNVDYPIGYVRWTESRNMGLFLRLLAEGRINLVPLAPTTVPIEDAPRAYDMLRQADRPPTVVLTYGGE